MNESQLKAFVRQAFSLQDTADREVLDVDALLGVVMKRVRKIVETLPDGSVTRAKDWKALEPLVKIEMAPYAQGLKQAVLQQEVAAAPEMKAYAIREAELAGAAITNNLGAPLASSVIEQVNRTRIGKKRFRELFQPKQGPVSPWVDGMFRVVNSKVQQGILEGMTTQQIANEVVHETITRGVPGVTLQGQTSTRIIRQQAMAMARTVSADVQHQIKEEVWNANADALEGFVYEWSAALDSRTCQSCAPIDGKRWDNRKDAPTAPLHVNCRCQLLLIDPEDEFWDDKRKTGQQISEKPFTYKGKPIDKLSKAEKSEASSKGYYVSKVKVKGERFYRKARTFSGNDYADYLASSNLTTQAEFFGGGPIGKRRARYFRNELDRMNKDPQQILQAMLTGPTNARKFIPLNKLQIAKPQKLATPLAKQSLSPEAKAAQKAELFAQREAARQKARQLKERASKKLASNAGMGSASLDRALAAAQKPVVKQVSPVVWSSLDGIDPIPLFEKSDDVLGTGLFGFAKLTAKGVAKKGQIARSEVQALKLLKGTGVTPEFLGVVYEQGTKFQTYLGTVPARKGALLMTKAPGKPLAKGARLDGKVALNAFDQFIGARKTIHLKGIAHEDMHLNNVMWDLAKQKLTVIDLGLARIDPRSALVEALGSRRGKLDFGKIEKPGDYQSESTFKWLNPRNASASNSKRWKQFAANRKKVEAILKDEGLQDAFANASIRKLPRAVSKAVSKERAMELLEILYEGV